MVEQGHGDGLYINSTGIGIIQAGVNPAPDKAQAGDVLIVNRSQEFMAWPL